MKGTASAKKNPGRANAQPEPAAGQAARTKAIRIARALLDKKALDLGVLVVGPLVLYTECLVIASATSSQHAKALVDNVEEQLAKSGVRKRSVEGYAGARWILMDYGDVVVHVFDRETRAFYALDNLLMDAPSIEVTEKDEDTDNLGGQDKGGLGG